MTTAKTIATSVLTTLVVLLTLGAAAVFAAREAVEQIEPAGTIAGVLFRSHGGHGWRSTGGPCARLDDGHIAEHATELNRWVQAELTLDATQSTALADVTTGLTDWARDIRAVCELPLDDAPSHVTAVAQITAATDAAMQRFSGSFTVFYATLGVEQRAKLDGWFEHHHHRAPS